MASFSSDFQFSTISEASLYLEYVVDLHDTWHHPDASFNVAPKELQEKRKLQSNPFNLVGFAHGPGYITMKIEIQLFATCAVER